MNPLRRKIDRTLASWKATAGHKPIVIKGCRQCGKTFSVMQFARKYYKHVVYLNFVEHDDYKLAFEQSKAVDDIIMNISAMIPDTVFEEGETCIVLDEIQECPNARASLKFFKVDGRYDVIATGSLLGVRGYGQREAKASIPVGYEHIEEMFPLDFENSFGLWALSRRRSTTYLNAWPM